MPQFPKGTNLAFPCSSTIPTVVSVHLPPIPTTGQSLKTIEMGFHISPCWKLQIPVAITTPLPGYGLLDSFTIHCPNIQDLTVLPRHIMSPISTTRGNLAPVGRDYLFSFLHMSTLWSKSQSPTFRRGIASIIRPYLLIPGSSSLHIRD
jgi:hypothetical protein